MESIRQNEILNEMMAKNRIVELETEFQQIAETLDEQAFYKARIPIDRELDSIFDQYPHLKEWNDNRID